MAARVNEFDFKPTFISAISLWDPDKKTFLPDSMIYPQLKKYDQMQVVHMAMVAKKHGENSRLQQWMFNDAEQEILTMEIRLISNVISNINVIDYIINLKPEKLSVRETDKMLTKMQQLFQEEPVTMLIHHQVIFQLCSTCAVVYQLLHCS